MSDDTAGWSAEAVTVLGDREPVGDANFRHGARPQVCAFPLPGGDDALVVVNEIGDVLAYADLAGEPRALPLTAEQDGGYRPLGRSAFPSPEYYKYAAAYPRADGGHDLLLSHACFNQTYLYRAASATDPLQFGPREPITTCVGIPAVIDWRRDGRCDLLLGGLDGRLLRLPRSAGETIGFDDVTPLTVCDEEGPIVATGPLSVSVVDVIGRGGRDLLLVDGDGCVELRTNLGRQGEPRYDRGRVLVRVDGPASATVVRQGGQRWLVVADAHGLLWRWALRQVQSKVIGDWSAAAGIQANPYPHPGSWGVVSINAIERGDPVQVAAAAPEALPPRERSHRNEVKRLDPPASPLVIALPARGWHEVHLTLRRPPGVDWDPRIVVQLDGQPTSQVMVGLDRHREPRQELYYGTFELSGQSLRLRQLEGAFQVEGGYPAWIESVRLTPASAPVQERASRPHVTTAAIFDAFMWNNHVATDRPDHIDDMIAWHRRAGFDIVYYKMGGGAWEYPSQVGGAVSMEDYPFEEFDDADREYCRRVKAMWESFDRFGESIQACHRHGLQCFGWIRLQNENEHFHGKYPLSRFYGDHQHMREKNVHGDFVRGKLCLGYPEVRRFHVDLAVEAMKKGADGIMLDTMRHLPKVMYGDPVVERFQREHGLDMRSLPPMDARVMAMQCTVMAEFLDELRHAMHSVKPGAPLHVRICKPYPLMGVDPVGWAKQGLVDVFGIEDRNGAMRPALTDLKRALQGSSAEAGYSLTRAYWGRSTRPLSARRVTDEADWAREQGVEHMAFYESADIIEYPEFCRAIRQINDPTQTPARTLVP